MNNPSLVFVVLAEHPHVHPIPLRVFSSSLPAEHHAYSVTQILWENSPSHAQTIRTPSLDSWRTTIADLGELYGTDECYLEIIECLLEPAMVAGQKRLYRVALSRDKGMAITELSGWAYDMAAVEKYFPNAIRCEEMTGTRQKTIAVRDIDFDITELSADQHGMADEPLLALAALACEVSAQAPQRLRSSTQQYPTSHALIQKIRTAMNSAKINRRKRYTIP
jgi:hypothetical protein